MNVFRPTMKRDENHRLSVEEIAALERTGAEIQRKVYPALLQARRAGSSRGGLDLGIGGSAETPPAPEIYARVSATIGVGLAFGAAY